MASSPTYICSHCRGRSTSRQQCTVCGSLTSSFAPPPTGAWWSIHSDDIISALWRAYTGEDPDSIFADLYASAERHEHPT